jgi:ribonuclease E
MPKMSNGNNNNGEAKSLSAIHFNTKNAYDEKHKDGQELVNSLANGVFYDEDLGMNVNEHDDYEREFDEEDEDEEDDEELEIEVEKDDDLDEEDMDEDVEDDELDQDDVQNKNRSNDELTI